MSGLGSDERPVRVAVVGSGPAGMYAVASLLDWDGGSIVVDIFERLPAPFGLVRYGVAPDHQKIKGVGRVFDRTCRDPRVTYYGNVEIGRDLSRLDLLDRYHQVVYAVGAQGDRKLGVPGEDLEGSWSSTEFVNWYNGHPDRALLEYPLDAEAVAVVGIGNVAMDVARILAGSVEELAKSDISDRALDSLRASRVREVHLLARRGPVQAKCSPPELKEIGELEGVRVVVDPRDLDLDPASEAALEEDRSATKNLELLGSFAEAPVDGPDGEERRIVFHFLTSPVEILGEDGEVVAVRCERNELVGEPGEYLASRGTGERFDLPVQRVIRAIGYRSEPLLDLPHDARRGVVPNTEGRVEGEDGPWTGEYVVGWVKRGPSGLIGSNKADAKETVAHMIEDLEAGRHLEPAADGAAELLEERGVRTITYEDWLRIEAAEEERGAGAGRPRNKFLRVADMLDVL